MKKIEIFEPAMCCETGLCGVGINNELLRISTVLDKIRKSGIEVNRYNLTNSPMAFVNNVEVNKLLNESLENLPITLVDNVVILTCRYLNNNELEELLDIKLNLISKNTKSCCCKGGKC